MKKKTSDLNVDDQWFNKIFLELKSAIGLGRYKDVDSWFLDNDIANDIALEKKVIQAIWNNSYFFSPSIYHSFDGKTSFNRIEIEKEELDRQISILKNLSFEGQLNLFGIPLSNAKSDHVKVLKLTSDNQHLFEKSAALCEIVVKLFTKEDFNELDKVQELLDFSIFESKSNNVLFPYHDDYSYGFSYAKLTKPIFKPKFELMFNYSETKVRYLEQNSISLPTEKEAKGLLNALTLLQKEKGTVHNFERIAETIEHYIVYKRHDDLVKTLPINQETKKRNKI